MTRKRPDPPAETPESGTETEIVPLDGTSEPDPAAAPDETRLVVRAIAAVKVGIGAIERAIAAATKALDDLITSPDGKAPPKYVEKTSKAASHVAWLTIQAAKVMGELRKGEAHDQQQLRKLTPAIVLEWYRQLEEDERADFIRRQDGIDRVLARGK